MSKVKENLINTEIFQIIYKTNQINEDNYNIKQITTSKSVKYNIELSTIGSDLELYGYFSSSRGDYKIFIINNIINNDDLDHILNVFIKKESSTSNEKLNNLLKEAGVVDVTNNSTQKYFYNIFINSKKRIKKQYN